MIFIDSNIPMYLIGGARDAIHVAAMERNAVKRIMSFDTDFDNVPNLIRIYE